MWVSDSRWAEALRGPFDVLVSNPPYIPTSQVDHLPLDVRQEPRLSLDGGPDGLAPYRTILAQAPARLSEGGLIIFECGEAQVTLLCALMQKAGCDALESIVDLAGRPRGVSGRWRPATAGR